MIEPASFFSTKKVHFADHPLKISVARLFL